MRKRLHRIYLLASAVTTLMAVLAIAMMVTVKIDDTRENLRMILDTSTAWAAESPDDFATLARHIADAVPPVRVTFMLRSGVVLADSEADYRQMEAHADRPEIKTALTGRIGESLRISDTDTALCLYAAKQISPMLILRLSYPLDATLVLAALYGAVLLAIFIALYFLERRTMARFARDVVGQMESIRRLLEGCGEESEAAFEEFKPVMDQIAYQIRRLHSDLEEISRTINLRSNFVANASHELRSPLTSIMGFAEMIDEGLADTPEEREMCMKMIRSECGRMLEVISDILLLSKAEAQQKQVQETVDAAKLTQEIFRSLAPQAAGKEIALTCTGAMTMNAAEKDIWEILYNLIQNGIRYGKEGGSVSVTLESGRIAVADDGVGIEKAHLPHLFEQFYRVDETRGMASGGTGLGLSIVRALVERYGGEITVESEPGAGSTFTVFFPQETVEEEGKEAGA